jgi:hypothetical protein
MTKQENLMLKSPFAEISLFVKSGRPLKLSDASLHKCNSKLNIDTRVPILGNAFKVYHANYDFILIWIVCIYYVYRK